MSLAVRHTHFLARVNLQVLHVLNGHLDDFRLLHTAAPFLHAGRREESG